MRRQVPETYPDGVPEIAAATGYPDDDDLAQAIILPRRPSRDRSTRTSWGRRSSEVTARSPPNVRSARRTNGPDERRDVATLVADRARQHGLLARATGA